MMLGLLEFATNRRNKYTMMLDVVRKGNAQNRATDELERSIYEFALPQIDAVTEQARELVVSVRPTTRS